MNVDRIVFLVSLSALGAIDLLGCSVASSASSASGTGGGGATAASSSGAGGGGGTIGTTTTTTATSGAGGSGGGSDGGVTDFLGATCTADADCGNALVCVKADDDDAVFGGGPAGGLCTHVCDDDADCPGTSSLCLSAGGGQPGRCALTCELGPPLAGDLDAPLDPGKCRGREDLRCAKVKGSTTACLPTCGSDAQCGPGRSCDPKLGVCVGQKSAGAPTGSSCDPAQMPTACAGTCVNFQFGSTMCSTLCVLGGDGLGAQDCGGVENGLCAFGPSDNGAGDFGYCTPSCVDQAGCADAHFWCFSVAGYTDQIGKGYCFSAVPCPNGQADCVDAQGMPLPYTCTETASGKLCLDPAFPLK
ncbi:MAG: hypothetical protein U0359_08755 [Byssovorax sp.]